MWWEPARDAKDFTIVVVLVVGVVGLLSHEEESILDSPQTAGFERGAISFFVELYLLFNQLSINRKQDAKNKKKKKKPKQQ